MSAQVIAVAAAPTTPQADKTRVWSRSTKSEELARRLEDERVAVYLARRGS